jgi:alpha-L-fucosidase
MLGSEEKITWKQENEALLINKPTNLPNYNVVAFCVKFKK